MRKSMDDELLRQQIVKVLQILFALKFIIASADDLEFRFQNRNRILNIKL